MNNKLKMILDILPLAVFFVIHKFWGIIPATGSLVITTILSLAITYYKTKKISHAPLVTGVLVTIFGTLTVVLHNEEFIKIKPTIVNLIFASILLGGAVFKKNFLQVAMEEALQMSDAGWKILNFRYGVFFIFLAILNELIWRNFSTDFWVNFKVFGMFSITILFTILQSPVIKKHSVSS